MDENHTEQITSGKALVLLLTALIVSAAAVGLFIRGGRGLGIFLAVLVAEAGLLVFLNYKKRTDEPCKQIHSASRRLLLSFLGIAIIALSSSYVLFANIMLQFLNFPVIVILYIVQLLLLSESSDRDWDEPRFWIDVGLAGLERPFACIPNLINMIGQLTIHENKVQPSATEPDSSKNIRSGIGNLGLILLGILCALPILLVAGSLLAAADPVFGRFFAGLSRFWQNRSLVERLTDGALTLFLFPFVFSFLESGRSHWLPARTKCEAGLAAGQQKTHTGRAHQSLHLNSTVLISFLTSINLLYLVFSIIQLTYLTGAFQSNLPAGMSYAEYARNGFFELAAISAINVGLIVLAVKGTDRQGLSGKLLRIQCLLLVTGSLVQWLSAMFRMNMYVHAYGETLLRFFISAFMILIAIIFILLVIKEFRPQFLLFKSAAVIAVLSLILLNAVNPDAWIAHHNVQRSLDDPSKAFDLSYFRELSPDALLVVLESLPYMDEVSKQALAVNLLDRYENLKINVSDQRWQSFNLCDTRALNLLEKQLPTLQEMRRQKLAGGNG